MKLSWKWSILLMLWAGLVAVVVVWKLGHISDATRAFIANAIAMGGVSLVITMLISK